jgi:hypothetical protein
MTEDDATAKRRRARRPTEAAARLERLRKRNTEQLEAQREAERRIESALQEYVDADVSISAVERACEEKVSGLERQIEQARTAAQQEVERIRARQAMAVWKINDSGRTAEQIAEDTHCLWDAARRGPSQTFLYERSRPGQHSPSIPASHRPPNPATKRALAGQPASRGSHADRRASRGPAHRARP